MESLSHPPESTVLMSWRFTVSFLSSPLFSFYLSVFSSYPPPFVFFSRGVDGEDAIAKGVLEKPGIYHFKEQDGERWNLGSELNGLFFLSFSDGCLRTFHIIFLSP